MLGFQRLFKSIQNMFIVNGVGGRVTRMKIVYTK